MTRLASSERHLTAQINERSIAIERRETILQTALRHGIDFPSSCRVGGCGACKCRLESGRVQELTETGYLLTAEEIEPGSILACQSVPRSDVRVGVDVNAAVSPATVRGRIVVQEKVTHDITALGVQLDEPLPYGPRRVHHGRRGPRGRYDDARAQDRRVPADAGGGHDPAALAPADDPEGARLGIATRSMATPPERKYPCSGSASP
jgi:ferredoxin